MAGRAVASFRPASSSRSRRSAVEVAGSPFTSRRLSTARRAIQLPPCVRSERSSSTASESATTQRFLQARRCSRSRVAERKWRRHRALVPFHSQHPSTAIRCTITSHLPRDCFAFPHAIDRRPERSFGRDGRHSERTPARGRETERANRRARARTAGSKDCRRKPRLART